MKGFILFNADENLIAIDQNLVKKEYRKEELFGDRESKSKRLKVRMDGNEIPLYDLPALFNESDTQTIETARKIEENGELC